MTFEKFDTISGHISKVFLLVFAMIQCANPQNKNIDAYWKRV